MASLSSIALSGMSAAQGALQVSANNIANSSTERFRREQLVQTSREGGGVDTKVVQAAEPGSALEADVVAQLQAKNAFLANLAVFKTSNQMAGALLDKKV
jgi:flagellar hook protein FlgE